MEMRKEVVLAARVGEAETIHHEGASLHPLDLLVLRRHLRRSLQLLCPGGFGAFASLVALKNQNG